MKCLRARFSVAKIFALAAAFVLACMCGLAGCSQQEASESGSGLVKSEDYPNTVTVDKLSMEYPGVFEVSKKYDAGQHAGDFPDGVSDTASALLLNKSGSVMITVVSADDSGSVGLDGLKEWVEAAPERLEKMKETQPEMYESLKNVERATPERTTVNGADALCAKTASGKTTTVTYYLAKDGAIAGYVSAVLPTTEYDANMNVYEKIVATTTIS